MRVLDAVEKVLSEARQPLHYGAITERFEKRGLWHSEGKTPRATVNASMTTDIKKNGESSRFQRIDRGVFALRSWDTEEYRPNKEASSSSTPKPNVGTPSPSV